MWKVVISFAAGVVVGSAATFFAVKGHFQEECDKSIEEAVKDANERANRRIAAKEIAEKNRKEKEELQRQAEAAEKSAEESPEGTPYAEQVERKVDIKKIRQEAAKRVTSYRKNIFEDPINKRDIQIIEGDFEDEVDDGEWIEEEDIPDMPAEGPREDPYVISADEFAYENKSWDKVTIYVYEDGNFIDEQNKVVDDIDAICGRENLERLEDLADSSGSVYIRNEMRSSDYELLLMNETYIPDTAPVRDD